MNISLLTVGSLKERYWREAVAEYEKRLSAHCKFRLIEIKDEKTPELLDGAAAERVRKREGERLLEKIDARALVVTLEIQGKKFDSEGFAAEMAKLEERSALLCNRRFTRPLQGSECARRPTSQLFGFYLSASIDARTFFGTTVSELPHKNRSPLSQIACVTGINLIY